MMACRLILPAAKHDRSVWWPTQCGHGADFSGAAVLKPVDVSQHQGDYGASENAHDGRVGRLRTASCRVWAWSPMEGKRCLDRACRQRHQPTERLGLAREICAERGVRLTATRRRVMELLWESPQPLGAYALVQALQQDSRRPVAPPTVYRALEFLMQQGLAAKIQSRNAYVPCAHPERSHNCVFFVCGNCGSMNEVENETVERLIEEDAERLGYRVTRQVVEVEGVCPDCAWTNGA